MAGARLEKISEIELNREPVQPPPLALSEAEFNRLADDSDRLTGEIERLAKARDAEVKKLDPELREDILADRRAVIVNAAQAEIDQRQQAIAENTAKFEAARDRWTRPALLSRAQFADDPTADATQRSVWMTRAQRANDTMLLTFATDAAARKDVALVGVLSEELNARWDNMKAEARNAIQTLLDSVPTGAEKVAPIFSRLETATQRARLASGRGTALDNISLGLRELGSARGASTRTSSVS